MALKVGINGFGRIGRVFFRAAWGTPGTRGRGGQRPDRRGDAGASAQARLGPRDVRSGGRREGRRHLRRRPARSACSPRRIPGAFPWRELGVDVVVESTGRFVDRASAGKHLEAGARKVIITAPAKDPDVTLVLGRERADATIPRSTTSSRTPPAPRTASPRSPRCCSTASACAAGYCTTIHSYTNDQNIQDFPHKDLRRARAGALSMIPTTTGAAKAVGLVLPSLKGKLDGIAIRVPTPNVSVVDLTAELERPASVDAVNEAFRAAAAGSAQGHPRRTRTSRSCRSTSTATRTPPSWTGCRRRWSTARSSRCSPGTTTSGATRAASATSSSSWGGAGRLRAPGGRARPAAPVPRHAQAHDRGSRPPGPPGVRAGRLQRPARARRRGERGRADPRGAAHAPPRADAGRARDGRRLASRPAQGRARGEVLARARRATPRGPPRRADPAGARLRRRGRRGPGRGAAAGRACCSSRTSGSTRGRRRTTPRSPGRSRGSATSTWTTPSPPRTAPTPRRRASRGISGRRWPGS